jgi:hypothetical protein
VNILIPSLVPPTEPLRRTLLNRAREVQGKYFHSLTGISDRAVSGGAWQPVIAMERTEYLKAFMKARTEGRSRMPPEMKACEMDLQVKDVLARLWKAARLGKCEASTNREARHDEGAEIGFYSE